MEIDREAYDVMWHAVETMDTNGATRYAHEHGVPKPTDDDNWSAVMMFYPDGSERLAWARSLRVIIDPAGTNDTYPQQSMEIDPELHARLLAETADMNDADTIAGHVRERGIAAPDESPDWEVYVDTVDGRDGERLVWHRSETVPIVPSDRVDAA